MNKIYNIKQLREVETILREDCEDSIRTLRTEYANDKSTFKVGDFIGNVTGIIKVDSIDLSPDYVITYTGLRYKKVKGVLSRTKDNKPSTLIYNLEKINGQI